MADGCRGGIPDSGRGEVLLITKGLEIMVDSVECSEVELMAFWRRHRDNGPFLIMAIDQISYESDSGNGAWICGVLFFHTSSID